MSFTAILNRLEQALPYADKANTTISQRGVDWHLEHSLKIIKSISNTLAASDPKDYKPKFSVAKYYILWTNKIPRGKGRSPKPFNTLEKIDVARLPERLKAAKEALEGINDLPAKSHFRHPLFGDLKYTDAKKFINIHTSHHLDIIDEIVKS